MAGNKGLTLIEALIALAVFAVISVASLNVWRYVSENSLELFDKTDSFENARAAMDALLINIQMADEMTLITDDNWVLEKLTLYDLNTEGEEDCYNFYYDYDAPKSAKKYHRLEFGENDEFASRLGMVRLKKDDGVIHITVSTDDKEPLTLECAVSIRNKICHDS